MPNKTPYWLHVNLSETQINMKEFSHGDIMEKVQTPDKKQVKSSSLILNEIKSAYFSRLTCLCFRVLLCITSSGYRSFISQVSSPSYFSLIVFNLTTNICWVPTVCRHCSKGLWYSSEQEQKTAPLCIHGASIPVDHVSSYFPTSVPVCEIPKGQKSILLYPQHQHNGCTIVEH